jgi:hypothetical protein
MRGPLLSGALGSAATLDRVCRLLQGHQPTVVLSALWLAEALASSFPVLALVEEDKRSAALRAVRRASKSANPLLVVSAGEDVPLGRGVVGAILIENLMDVEEQAAAEDLLVGLLPALRSDGVVASLDATRHQETEARLAALFLAAALTGITQARPREGALLTIGSAPPPAVTVVRAVRPLAVPGEPRE